MDGESLKFRIKTKIFKFWMSFFACVYMMGLCLCIFYLHFDDVIIPWELTKQADFVT